MILYHFTAKRFLYSITKGGLNLGGVPTSLDPPQVTLGYIWLTRNCSWNQTSLEGSGKLPYRRTEARITIEVPETENLIRWMGNWEHFITPEFEEILHSFSDHQNWWIHKGTVHKKWFRAIDYRPKKTSGS